MRSLTYRIEDHPENERQALGQVVAQTRLGALGISVNAGGVNDGQQSREARRDKCGDPKLPPSTALEPGVHDDDGGQEPQYTSLPWGPIPLTKMSIGA